MTTVRQTIRQSGISPKVLVPAAGQILIGVLFLLIGMDVEGKTAIATGLGTFVTGWTAKPGKVIVKAKP